MRPPSAKLLLAGIILASVCITIVTFFSFYISGKVKATNKDVSLSQDVILKAEKIKTALVYYESNFKTYLVTPEEGILNLLKEVEADINKEISGLSNVATYDSVQFSNVDSLRFYIGKRLNYSNNIMAIRREKGLSQAIPFMKSEEASHFIKKTRLLVREIQDYETKFMQVKEEQRRKAIQNFNLMLILLFLILLLLITLAVFLNIHNRREKVNAEKNTRYLEKILDSVAEAIITTDAQFKIQSWNKAAELLYGFEIGKTNGMDISAAVKSQLLPEAKDKARNEMINRGKWEGETVHLNAAGEEITILSSTSALYKVKNELTGFVSSNLDITDRKIASQLLFRFNEELALKVKLKTEELTNVFERVTDAFVALDSNWCFVYVNKKAGEMINRKPESLIGKHFWTEFPGGVGHPLFNTYNRAMNEQEFVQVEEYYAPNDRWFLNLIYPSPDGLSIYFQDITDRKKAEERLNQSYEEIRKLTTHLVNIREEERIAVAHELHDELGQQLTALKMNISWLSKKLTETDETTDNKVKEILSLIDDAVKTIRRISSELRPGILDDLGLIAAMDWQVREFQKKSGIAVHFSVMGNATDSKGETATGLYRILQESLTNVMRHAQAENINVILENGEDAITLSISDDGIGFDPELMKKNRTLGLLGMNERIRIMGGTFEIESKPGDGATINVSVPNKPSGNE